MSTQGSIKNKVVAPELVEERARLNFDKNELFKIFESDKVTREMIVKSIHDMENDPELHLSEKYYEMTNKE